MPKFKQMLVSFSRMRKTGGRTNEGYVWRYRGGSVELCR